MKKDFFLTRYALIIKRLEKSAATYEEIEDFLLNSFEFQDANVNTYSKRTLQRDLKAIQNLFNLEIENNRSNQFKYTIVSRPIMEVDEYNQRLLESYQIINTLNSYPDFEDYVYLESRKHRGINYFYELLHSIRNRKVIEFNYHNYAKNTHSTRKVYPLILKESKDRWYLLAVDKKDDLIKCFGLDRISNLFLFDATFQKIEMDFETYFKYSFGIISFQNQTPYKIILECSTSQKEYIKSFPLHDSQTIIEETVEKCVFEMLLYPTYDFMQEILSYGKEVKILEPPILINQVREQLIASCKNYNIL
ncbi:MAG TPA: WYL domain-containing protein [Flavobacteriaceae bacterium]|nr:WYL domain-containing protein [Flavobacteriaceae bacterium]